MPQAKVEIKVDGTALTAAMDAHRISFEWIQSMDHLDMMTIRFRVPSSSASADLLALSGKIGKKLAATLTAKGETLDISTDLMEVTIEKARGEPLVLVLRGLESLHRLRGHNGPKLWEGAAKKIVSDVVSAHGLSAQPEDVEDTPTFTLQAHEDDAIFLKRLAREHNYYLRVVDDKVQFGRRHVAQDSAVEIALDADIYSFRTTISLHDTVTKVSVVGYDYKKPEPIKAEADKAKLKKISGGKTCPELASAAFGDRVELIHTASCNVVSVAQVLATSALQEHAQNLVQGTVVCGPVPTAQVGRALNLVGPPWPVVGPFLIRQVAHRIDPAGYRTTIEFFSDSLPPES